MTGYRILLCVALAMGLVSAALLLFGGDSSESNAGQQQRLMTTSSLSSRAVEGSINRPSEDSGDGTSVEENACTGFQECLETAVSAVVGSAVGALTAALSAVDWEEAIRSIAGVAAQGVKDIFNAVRGISFDGPARATAEILPGDPEKILPFLKGLMTVIAFIFVASVVITVFSMSADFMQRGAMTVFIDWVPSLIAGLTAVCVAAVSGAFGAMRGPEGMEPSRPRPSRGDRDKSSAGPRSPSS